MAISLLQQHVGNCSLFLASYTVANEAEGLIRFEVQNISSAGERLLSNKVFIRGLKWYIIGLYTKLFGLDVKENSILQVYLQLIIISGVGESQVQIGL